MRSARLTPVRQRVADRALQIALFAALVVALVASTAAAGPGTKTITFDDLMKFRAIQSPAISEDGTIVAYALQPDRGDGEGVIHALGTGKVYRVPRGGAPSIARDGRHVAMPIKLSLADSEKPAKDRPKPGMAVVEVSSGKVTTRENVERFALSDDGRWLAFLVSAPEAKRDEKEAGEKQAGEKQATPPAAAGRGNAAGRTASGVLRLIDLSSGDEHEIGRAGYFGFDPGARFLVYAVSATDGSGNGLFARSLGDLAAARLAIAETASGRYENATWTKDGARLAFLAAVEKEKDKPGPAGVWVWDAATRAARELAAAAGAPKGWTIPLKNDLAWSRDGQRLFFGYKPTAAEQPKPGDGDILAKAELDIWHWKDPQIQSQQKVAWEREKDRTYRAVLHLGTGRAVPLADCDLPDVQVAENARVALGTSDVPYARQTTWGERTRDVYVVNLETGERTIAVRALRDQALISPDGRSIAYFAGKHWHLHDIAKGTSRNVTGPIGVVFEDEQHDTPGTPRAYGFGGWVDEGRSFLVYDAFDIWQIPAAGGDAVNLTSGKGRAAAIRFRVVTLDPEKRALSSGEPLLLTAYHDREKNWGFYTATAGKPGVEARMDEKKLVKFVAKAGQADRVLYTRESYEEFPDLWIADTAFRQPRKVSDANPQLGEFAWGSAELVDYTSLDGVPLQGVLIKPANYRPGTRYPVITYFYERQSQRLYEFNEPVVNHRPSFAVYAGAGYAVFLPDIVFTVGTPGPSMLKCVIPGVQKLVDMGVADPKALGLHGHSWGGYGTAYLVTQTSLFAAAVAGAPVANMTSAYGGIRWESGVARQFQYEQTQSRIGGSLWDYPERFFENSALFFADRVTTPLLIQHGDEDGAVPWYQAIEMYLALRRLDKDCIFLQYRGEPHHLRKYPNKLDYSIKMKQYFDHYLKGEPAAEWITAGRSYPGK
ncbi:MAG TPA: prolyl oligopeptidase family serine peptidase [Vicinamibacterales bacterium]|nr:prolyl oligopeptidase family serine peptidase [Vicinamibacterales bacterium]